jgi:hypothetical protein
VAFFFRLRLRRQQPQIQQPWRTKEAKVLRGLDDRRVVPLTLLAQAGLSIGLAAFLGIWWGGTAVLSALLGGLTAVLPNAFLAARMLAPHADDAKAVMRSAWLGAGIENRPSAALATVNAFGATAITALIHQCTSHAARMISGSANTNVSSFPATWALFTDRLCWVIVRNVCNTLSLLRTFTVCPGVTIETWGSNTQPC